MAAGNFLKNADTFFLIPSHVDEEFAYSIEERSVYWTLAAMGHHAKKPAQKNIPRERRTLENEKEKIQCLSAAIRISGNFIIIKAFVRLNDCK